MSISKLLYGTGNQAKLTAMRQRLAPLGIELIGLGDMKKQAPHVEETGSNPLENAIAKATAYYEAYGIPVFSCDSGLYFESVPDEIQPGVHVRTVGGKTLTDAEMVAYYSSLASQYGDLTARYRNAICFVYDRENVFSSMDDSLASVPFIIASKPHGEIRRAGFPIDSLSIDITSGKYYYDMDPAELDRVAVEDGFLVFFERVLKQCAHVN